MALTIVEYMFIFLKLPSLAIFSIELNGLRSFFFYLHRSIFIYVESFGTPTTDLEL